LKHPKPEKVDDWFGEGDYVRQCVEICTGKDMSKVDLTHVIVYFLNNVVDKITDLFLEFPTTYEPKQITEFKHKGKTYLLPNSIKVNGEVILQHDGKAKRFVEASNLMAGWAKSRKEAIQNVALFISAYVQDKASEQWDEKRVIERSYELADLPMSTVWDVFFCISQHIVSFETAIHEYMVRAGEREVKQAQLVMKVGFMALRGKDFISRSKKRVKRLFGKFAKV
jgi:hypothetical protein